MSKNILFRINFRACLLFIILTGIPALLSAQKDTEINITPSAVKASESKIRFDQTAEPKGAPVILISHETQTVIAPVETAEPEPKDKEQPDLLPAKKEDQ